METVRTTDARLVTGVVLVLRGKQCPVVLGVGLLTARLRVVGQRLLRPIHAAAQGVEASGCLINSCVGWLKT